MKGAIIFVLFTIAVVQGQFSKKSTRKRINEEAKPGVWHTIDLPLDHFNVLDNRTYRARYITNDQFYKKGGPLIVYVGGEWSIEEYGVMGGVAFQLARQHNGYLFYPEHRYFGESLPFPKPVSTENLRYITPDYSLADLAFSISHIKETVDGLKNSQVVVAGGSYAGALAIWGRLKYPHIIDIAYACGGVIKTETFNPSYYDVTYRHLKKINPKCLDIIKTGIDKARKLSLTKKGLAKLYKMFPEIACEGIDTIYDMPHRIHNNFNPQIWPIYKTHKVCRYVVENTSGSPLERLAQTISYSANGIDSCYEVDREWFFLVCTFLGNLQTTNSSNFGDLFTQADKIKDPCIRIFGPEFNQDFIDKSMRSSAILYGGTTPDVRKVLSLQGTHDPWYPNGILDDLNDETPVVYIEDANHCLEIGEEQDNESPQVAQSKIEILQLLAKWIK